MSKILYVVSRPLQINTSASIRNKATITGLVENGYQVDLVTTVPDVNHMAFDSSMELEGVNCHYIKLGGIQSIAKVGRRFKFLKPLYNFGLKFLKNNNIYDNLVDIVNHTNELDLRLRDYDYIISSSDPKSSHLFIEKLLDERGSLFHGKWIQIWGDPFFDDITLPSGIDKRKVYDEESRLLSKADKIVYVSKLTLKKQKVRYELNASKMEYNPIPYLKEITFKQECLQEKKNITLAYCGDYASSIRNVKPLYEAIKEMDGVKCIICGNTAIDFPKTDNIIVYPRQSHDVVVNIEAQSDILIHLSNLRGGQIPGKLFQYSGTNKPILFILDGEMELLKSEFEPYDRYVFADNNKNSIKKAIEEIINTSRNYSPVKEFSKKNIASHIIRF